MTFFSALSCFNESHLAVSLSLSLNITPQYDTAYITCLFFNRTLLLLHTTTALGGVRGEVPQQPSPLSDGPRGPLPRSAGPLRPSARAVAAGMMRPRPTSMYRSYQGWILCTENSPVLKSFMGVVDYRTATMLSILLRCN